MALASEGQPISGDNDSNQQNQCQLKLRKSDVTEVISKKKVTFDQTLTRSDNDKKSTTSANDEELELPKHVVYKLYLNRLLSAFADRTWDFACGEF